MIRINLLPPDYRHSEGTPLPVFLALIGALVLLGGAGIYYLGTVKTGLTLVDDEQQLIAEKSTTQGRADKYDVLRGEIKDRENRIATVFRIAESRFPWSIKLEQFVEIMPRNIWIEGLNMERRSDGTGEIKLRCNARGTSLQAIAEFKQRLRENTNFFHHFKGAIETEIIRKSTGEEYVEPYYLSFELKLPLREAELGAKKSKGKK